MCDRPDWKFDLAKRLFKKVGIKFEQYQPSCDAVEVKLDEMDTLHF